MDTCIQNTKKDDIMWYGAVVKEILAVLASASGHYLHIK
jgi:hypothetical protein